MEPGVVYFDREELRKLADYLRETIDELIARLKFAREGERFVLDATDGRGCPLLGKDRACTVHPVKPKQCATFPFWPQLLDDEREWESAKRFCPGIDSAQGKIYSRGEILAIRAGWTGT